jgi:hypothetical protein
MGRFESKLVGSDSRFVTSPTEGTLGRPGTPGRLGVGSPPTPGKFGIGGTPTGNFGSVGRPGMLGVLGIDTPGIAGNPGALTGLWIEAESKLAFAVSGPNFPPH